MSLEDEGVSELRATAHPVRLQMLSLLTGAELSAAEVARELGITQANASYHLRTLESAGLLVVAGEERVRGGLAKRYRHPWDAPSAGSRTPSEAERRQSVRVLAEMVPRRYAQRAPGQPGRFTDADLWVDPDVWDRVVALLDEASALFHASARPPRTEGAVRANLTTAAFRLRTDEEHA